MTLTDVPEPVSAHSPPKNANSASTGESNILVLHPPSPTLLQFIDHEDARASIAMTTNELRRMLSLSRPIMREIETPSVDLDASGMQNETAILSAAVAMLYPISLDVLGLRVVPQSLSKHTARRQLWNSGRALCSEFVPNSLPDWGTTLPQRLRLAPSRKLPNPQMATLQLSSATRCNLSINFTVDAT
ncbi:hypothetical protein ARMSODRAFT_1020274 [Armillaria solidipes]|uniref:Uncharacterized protein n=1 Tax=Armillaria solidipes TaxID=1076256 RepID=A0A2H3BT35_9AGAR|nr:hypothetical protein ARMSODRAFT_1020274 [Armillaria solidipes]